MNRTLAAAAAGALATVVLVVAANAWTQRDRQHAAPAQAERSSTEDALRAQVQALGARIVMLEMQAARKSTEARATAEPPAASQPSSEEPADRLANAVAKSPSEEAAEEARRFNEYHGELDARRLAETPDPELAQEVERGVTTALMQEPPLSGTRVQKIECGSTLCRIEATHESSAARRIYIGMLPLRIGETLDHASIFAPVDELRTVAYFVRRGAQKPPWPAPPELASAPPP